MLENWDKTWYVKISKSFSQPYMEIQFGDDLFNNKEYQNEIYDNIKINLSELMKHNNGREQKLDYSDLKHGNIIDIICAIFPHHPQSCYEEYAGFCNVYAAIVGGTIIPLRHPAYFKVQLESGIYRAKVKVKSTNELMKRDRWGHLWSFYGSPIILDLQNASLIEKTPLKQRENVYSQKVITEFNMNFEKRATIIRQHLFQFWKSIKIAVRSNMVDLIIFLLIVLGVLSLIGEIASGLKLILDFFQITPK
jgi:hypothetical protein